MKILECVSEVTFLLTGNSNSNSCGTSVAMALSRAYNDSVACEAGLRVLYAVSVRRKNYYAICEFIAFF